eukprot:293552_1
MCFAECTNQNLCPNYMDSLNTWNELKQENDGCYEYLQESVSGDGELIATWAVVVEHGVVIERWMDIIRIADGSYITGYQETIAQDNIGENGGNTKTMDELYQSCEDFLNKYDDNYFDTNELGILRSCANVISISSFSFNVCSGLFIPETTDEDFCQNYTNSLNTWNELKQETGGCYEYSTVFASVTGHFFTTTIKVENGVVIERLFEITKDGRQIESWQETIAQDNIGEHGGSPKTMDELYQSCEYHLNKNDQIYDIYFETNEDCILRKCGFRDKLCSDDCFRGISINSFSFMVCSGIFTPETTSTFRFPIPTTTILSTTSSDVLSTMLSTTLSTKTQFSSMKNNSISLFGKNIQLNFIYIGIAGLIFILIMLILLCYCIKRNHNKKNHKYSKPNTSQEQITI